MTLAVGKGGYSALRRGRSSFTGQVYLVTATTARRRRLFEDFERSVRFCQLQSALTIWQRHSLTCWVLMPDHYHGLIELGSGEQLHELVQKFKANIARGLRLAEPTLGDVWSPGFHDHFVRNDESLVEVARYVVANPVRAGLVSRAGLYPFWDATWLPD